MESAKWKRSFGPLLPGALLVALGLAGMAAMHATSNASADGETATSKSSGNMATIQRAYCEGALRELGREVTDVILVENTDPFQLTLVFASGSTITCKFIDPAILSVPVVRISAIELDGQKVPDGAIDRINVHNASEERKSQ